MIILYALMWTSAVSQRRFYLLLYLGFVAVAVAGVGRDFVTLCHSKQSALKTSVTVWYKSSQFISLLHMKVFWAIIFVCLVCVITSRVNKHPLLPWRALFWSWNYVGLSLKTHQNVWIFLFVLQTIDNYDKFIKKIKIKLGFVENFFGQNFELTFIILRKNN